jgi:photosystem II stability/assembly factor-like uncharacterized protein
MKKRFPQISQNIPLSVELIKGTCLWFLITLACLCTTAPAAAANDPLMIPAEKVSPETVLTSMFFDVVNTGGRLVAVGERGHIVYSEDNGSTWTQADVPVSVTLTAVCFPTARNGWAVGHDGVVLHSSDGGDSWTKQLDGNRVNELVMVQVEQLLAAKKNQVKEAHKALLEKLQRELEDLEFFMSDARSALEEGPCRPFMDVWFKNEKEGLIIGAFGTILHTGDGGANWRPILDRLENPDGYHYYGITQSGDSLFIAGEEGMLFRSDDEGGTWIRLESPCEGSFFGIIGDTAGAFVIAFGLGGQACRSTDGGDTWSQIRINSMVSLSGGVVLSDGSLALTGINGVVFHSSDGGESFRPLSKRFPGCIAISDVDANRMVLVGIGGLMNAAVKSLPE